MHVAGTSSQGGQELRRPSRGLKANVRPYVPVAQRTADTQALATAPVTKPQDLVGSLQSRQLAAVNGCCSQMQGSIYTGQAAV